MEPRTLGHTSCVGPFAEVGAEIVLALPPDPTAARRARRALREAHLPEDLQHTVDLLATELIGNAVRHAGATSDQRIGFAARFHGDHIRVEVADPGPGFDLERAIAGKGFGLRLVEKLASRWGVETGKGTRVWFEVDRRSRRFPRGGTP
jgi:anti-sigma regulatory factor (Ser/Thr protein kinase)